MSSIKIKKKKKKKKKKKNPRIRSSEGITVQKILKLYLTSGIIN